MNELQKIKDICSSHVCYFTDDEGYTQKGCPLVDCCPIDYDPCNLPVDKITKILEEINEHNS